jgi:hypothetical protein
MKNYYKITKETPNPFRDKRCQYGIRRKNVLPEGTIIEAFIDEEVIEKFIERNGLTDSQSLRDELGRKFASYYIGMFSFGVEAFDKLPTAPHELDPVEEFDTLYSRNDQSDMVREFLQKGIVTIDQVREYFTRD